MKGERPQGIPPWIMQGNRMPHHIPPLLNGNYPIHQRMQALYPGFHANQNYPPYPMHPDDVQYSSGNNWSTRPPPPPFRLSVSPSQLSYPRPRHGNPAPPPPARKCQNPSKPRQPIVVSTVPTTSTSASSNKVTASKPQLNSEKPTKSTTAPTPKKLPSPKEKKSQPTVKAHGSMDFNGMSDRRSCQNVADGSKNISSICPLPRKEFLESLAASNSTEPKLVMKGGSKPALKPATPEPCQNSPQNTSKTKESNTSSSTTEKRKSVMVKTLVSKSVHLDSGKSSSEKNSDSTSKKTANTSDKHKNSYKPTKPVVMKPTTSKPTLVSTRVTTTTNSFEVSFSKVMGKKPDTARYRLPKSTDRLKSGNLPIKKDSKSTPKSTSKGFEKHLNPRTAPKSATLANRASTSTHKKSNEAEFSSKRSHQQSTTIVGSKSQKSASCQSQDSKSKNTSKFSRTPTQDNCKPDTPSPDVSSFGSSPESTFEINTLNSYMGMTLRAVTMENTDEAKMRRHRIEVRREINSRVSPEVTSKSSSDSDTESTVGMQFGSADSPGPPTDSVWVNFSPSDGSVEGHETVLSLSPPTFSPEPSDDSSPSKPTLDAQKSTRAPMENLGHEKTPPIPTKPRIVCSSPTSSTSSSNHTLYLNEDMEGPSDSSEEIQACDLTTCTKTASEFELGRAKKPSESSRKRRHPDSVISKHRSKSLKTSSPIPMEISEDLEDILLRSPLQKSFDENNPYNSSDPLGLKQLLQEGEKQVPSSDGLHNIQFKPSLKNVSGRKPTPHPYGRRNEPVLNQPRGISSPTISPKKDDSNKGNQIISSSSMDDSQTTSLSVIKSESSIEILEASSEVIEINQEPVDFVPKTSRLYEISDGRGRFGETLTDANTSESPESPEGTPILVRTENIIDTCGVVQRMKDSADVVAYLELLVKYRCIELSRITKVQGQPAKVVPRRESVIVTSKNETLRREKRCQSH